MRFDTHIRPLFYIMGERKCGTSSLYRHLNAHPLVLPCRMKEPQFFSKAPAYIESHPEEYEALFPLIEGREDVSYLWPELNAEGILYHETVTAPRQPGLPYVSGEASANTFHEVDPSLLHRYLPDIKLIVLFRDPVARAWSQYRMYERFRDEGRTLPVQLRDFDTDVRAEIELIRQGGRGEFLSPGIYLENLQRWVGVYGRDAIKVLFTHSLDTRPQALLDEVLHWLGLPPHAYGAHLAQRFNQAPPAEMPPESRERLDAFFRPYDEALSHYLGERLPWR